jgi:transcriptional regulator of acetoin/glycerol metabolism
MIMDTKSLLSVYSIVSGEGGRDLWVEIGHATPHHDGRGFDLTLRALPLEPKLVLRESSQGALEGTTAPSLASQVREFERATIRQCLLETGGNIAAALDRLKIPRRTLNEKMARLGIDRRRLTRPLRQSDTVSVEQRDAIVVPAE